MTTSTKIYSGLFASLGVILLIFVINFAYSGCLSAGNAEAEYNFRVQTSAVRWVAGQPQMQLTPTSLMCIPRSFGSRMPQDLTSCRGLTTGNYRVPLLCNMQGCTIDHSLYQF